MLIPRQNAKYINITFFPNSVYLHYETGEPNNADEDDGGGVEIGKYSYDSVTKDLIVTEVIVDNNGSTGLSLWGSTGNIYEVEIRNDQLIAAGKGEILILERVK